MDVIRDESSTRKRHFDSGTASVFRWLCLIKASRKQQKFKSTRRNVHLVGLFNKNFDLEAPYLRNFRRFFGFGLIVRNEENCTTLK